MNTSVEKNNPEVLSGNKTGGIHSLKSLISPSNQKKTEKTQHSTKQNKTRTKTCNHKNAFSFQSWTHFCDFRFLPGDFYLYKQGLSKKLLILSSHTINQISRNNKILSLQEHTD